AHNLILYSKLPTNVILIFILNDDCTEAHRDMWAVKVEGKDQTGKASLNKRKDRMTDSVLNMCSLQIFTDFSYDCVLFAMSPLISKKYGPQAQEEFYRSETQREYRFTHVNILSLEHVCAENKFGAPKAPKFGVTQMLKQKKALRDLKPFSG
ncbi:hypothetical protein STEG23_008005, partial [Scotinomys teguina]